MAKRALIVDNDRVCVEIVGEILRREGYEVSAAYDGLEALDALGGALPELVILDIVMPKIDGDRVLHFMRGNPRTSRIPVIILSGTLAEDREKILALKADAYVAKARVEDMRENLRAALQSLQNGVPAQGDTVLGMEKAVTRLQVRELLAIKRHKEAILRAVGEGVVEADGDHRVVYVNPAGLAILGRAEVEVIGTPVIEILSIENTPTLENVVTRLKASPARPTEPTGLRYGERVLRIAFAWIVPDRPEKGLFMIMQDISDLARNIEELSALNARLQEMERMRSEFLAMISHDLHTPLTAIKGSLEVLLHEGVGVELGRELLGIAQKNTDRLFRMVSDILDLARIEAGRFEIRREAFDIAGGLRGAMERLRPLARDRGIELSLDATEGLPTVMADAVRMDQVFVNLIGNALKFTPRGGRVTVSVRELPADLQVEIRDTGIGIPPEHLERIFDRFYRAPLPEGERVEGVGLGLSICKAVVDEHGGRIWVESVVGRGSCFSFTLPKGSGQA